MAYFEDTINCDDPACDICVHEHGREYGHNRCQQCGLIDCDIMVLHTELWDRIAEDPKLLLCPDCMSNRLAKVRGYGIVSEDLTDCLINYLSSPEMMARSL